MALVCIPQHLVQSLKDSALAGKVDIQNLYKMSSKERRDFFAKHTDPELGKFINTEFEKAMISKQKTALTDWAKSIFTPTAQSKPAFKTVLDKINNLDELGVLNPATEKAFLEDLVTDKLGIHVTPAEVRAISVKAKAIDQAQEKLGTDLGSPTKLRENLDFFEAKKKMDDYLQSLNPAPKLRVLTGTIGRGMMLASVKSPILNIGSNIEVGLTEGIGRRIASRGLRGADNGLARDYIKMVNKVYQKTGYDLSRMTSLSDTGASGARVLDDTVHAQGKGAVRKTGQVIEDTVFKQLMGAPDTASASIHFADSVNLNALKMAKGDKLKARSYMQDAMRIDPQTPKGELLRNQAIMDAQFATWTNKSWATQVTLGVRKIFNDLSGNLRLGDYLFPFVKTPANVISTGLDYAGLGIPKALVKTVNAIRKGHVDEQFIRSASRDLTRAGLGLTAALAIASNLKPEDFVGAYDPNRAQIEQLRNSNYNAVKIGGKWISTDWFGPLSVPLTSMMYAKKYGKSSGGMAYQYGKGLQSATMNLPGVKDVTNFAANQKQKQSQTPEEARQAAIDYAEGEASARLLPSIISDVARGTDPYQRQGNTGVAGIKSKIPGARESLPIKKNVFGEKQKSEGFLSTILFGSRVKTARDTKITDEVQRVSEAADKTLNFTDWTKSTSKELAQFKQKVGDQRFKAAQDKYGKQLQINLNKAISNPAYKNLSDEDKYKVLSNADSDAKSKVFKSYGFKPKRTQSKKLNLY